MSPVCMCLTKPWRLAAALCSCRLDQDEFHISASPAFHVIVCICVSTEMYSFIYGMCRHIWSARPLCRLCHVLSRQPRARMYSVRTAASMPISAASKSVYVMFILELGVAADRTATQSRLSGS